jgi:hypothetical protein
LQYCDTLFAIFQNAAVQNLGGENKKANNLLQSEHSEVMQPVARREPQQDEYDLEDLESELEGRRHRVWEVCVAHGLNTAGEPNAWEFFIDSTHGLVWCNIFKAASSTWLYNFNILGK